MTAEGVTQHGHSHVSVTPTLYSVTCHTTLQLCASETDSQLTLSGLRVTIVAI